MGRDIALVVSIWALIGLQYNALHELRQIRIWTKLSACTALIHAGVDVESLHSIGCSTKLRPANASQSGDAA